jgi:hypothetical protein
LTFRAFRRPRYRYATDLVTRDRTSAEPWCTAAPEHCAGATGRLPAGKRALRAQAATLRLDLKAASMERIIDEVLAALRRLEALA